MRMVIISIILCCCGGTIAYWFWPHPKMFMACYRVTGNASISTDIPRPNDDEALVVEFRVSSKQKISTVTDSAANTWEETKCFEMPR